MTIIGKGMMVNTCLSWDVIYSATLENVTYTNSMDEWWLIGSDDFIKQIADPVIEKVSANRIKYVFSMADP